MLGGFHRALFAWLENPLVGCGNCGSAFGSPAFPHHEVKQSGSDFRRIFLSSLLHPHARGANQPDADRTAEDGLGLAGLDECRDDPGSICGLCFSDRAAVGTDAKQNRCRSEGVKLGDFQQSTGGQMACWVARLFEAFWAAARVCAKSV